MVLPVARDDGSRFPAGVGRRLAVQSLFALVIGLACGAFLHEMGVGAPSIELEPAASVASARLERGGAISEEVVRAAADSVLLVEASGCGTVRQASATVLRHEGRVLGLTNAHAVIGAGTAVVRADGGDTLAVDVRGAAADRDAALLDLDGSAGTMTALEVGSPPLVGDELAVAGFPDGAPRVEVGRLTGVERRAAYGGSSDVLLIDVEVTGGSSGGAVLDASGAVVGLVAARDPRTGHAVAYPIAEVLGRGLAAVPSC